MPLKLWRGTSRVARQLADAGYAGAWFEQQVWHILSAQVKIAKRNELRKFVVILKRWVVERSFAGLEKCPRLWKNCERKLHTRVPFVVLAFIALLSKGRYLSGS
jgi:transposase